MLQKVIFVLVGICVFTSITYAEVKLPAIFGDHMVLQQNSSVAVWGWADPGEKIEVKGCWQWFGGAKTRTDENGHWSVTIKTPKPSDNTATLKIKGNNEIILSDILLGEVWICSGQSNMQWTMNRLGTDISKQDIEKADHPQIRFFTVKREFSATPKEDIEGSWQICSPETVGNFSATGYYFGKNLNETLNMPIGLVSTNWGGTKAEAWASKETIDQFNQFDEVMAMIVNPEKRSNEFKMHQNQPTALYNAMIAPCCSTALQEPSGIRVSPTAMIRLGTGRCFRR